MKLILASKSPRRKEILEKTGFKVVIEPSNFAEKKTEKFNNIEEIEIASPATFSRFTDTPDGTIYGYLGKKGDGVVARRMEKTESHIKGLHFAGGYGNMLLGYSSALSSGRGIAHRILNT